MLAKVKSNEIGPVGWWVFGVANFYRMRGVIVWLLSA
jgi:hypothetical protein